MKLKMKFLNVQLKQNLNQLLIIIMGIVIRVVLIKKKRLVIEFKI